MLFYNADINTPENEGKRNKMAPTETYRDREGMERITIIDSYVTTRETLRDIKRI